MITATNEELFDAYLCGDGNALRILMERHGDGGGYSSENAPTDGGEYLLTISVPDRDDLPYAGSQSYPFIIEKRPVTIKVEDKVMTAGEPLPAFTYIVEGVLPGETALIGEPKLTCVANGKTAGSYEITVDLTGVSYTPNYKAADPAFVKGTLTVNPAPGAGGSSGRRDDSSEENRSTSVKAPKAKIKVTGNNVTATTTAKAVVDGNGEWVDAFNQAQLMDVIDNAIKEAEKLGEDAIANVALNVEAPADATAIQANIPKDAVTHASKAGVGSFTISIPVGYITFDSSALSELSEKAAGDLKIKISRVETSSLSNEAQRMIGDRPVFDISITGGGNIISQFGGDVTVSVPYTPKEGEDINAIVIYYINASGELEIVSNCIYDPETGMVIFTTKHFSLYGVGYNKITFNDVAESTWYSKVVTFIAAREITKGTRGGNFSPEAKLTRGQFMVMLMKAYGIVPDEDAKDNFEDADSIAPWANEAMQHLVETGIIRGNGGRLNPTGIVTRGEMAQVLYNLLGSLIQKY